jgi:hypothetical protein
MKKTSLTLSALLLLAAVASTALARDFWLDPYFWPDPHVETYVSGGTERIDGCPGYVARQPDHIMVLTDDFDYLRLFVDSGGEDTTLVLHQPSTGDTFCDDDGYGNRQPQIVMDYITEGEWHIYVGSFWPDELHPYALHVTEFRPQAAPAPQPSLRPLYTAW